MRPNGLLRYASLLILTSSVGLGACNALTGVEDLVIDESSSAGPGGGQGGDGNGGNTGSTTGAGAGHTTTSTGTTTTTTTTTPPDTLVDASGVGITQIALYQGVKATLMENGAAASNAVPIVAGRDALMRLFLSVDGNYNNQPVIARLYIDGVAEPIELTTGVNGAPKDNQLSSTLNFKIPGAAIVPGFAFRVELVQSALDSKGPSPAAHYPAEGFASTNAQSVGQSIKIVLVPIQYGADGSNRLPDLSAGQIQGYKDLFYAMYPTPAIDLTVRAAVQYNSTVSSNGAGWDNLLGTIGQLKADDNAAFEVYYYGIFSPSQSVNTYCGGGCVAGLGNIGGISDSYARSAIGLGFAGDIAWETAVHEIGHTHGRYHSPCGGAQGTDPAYPYQNAIIGVWGYNLLTEQLFSPSGFTDVMGYCQPIWVSDFTYKGLFNRVKALSNASIVYPPELMNRTYDRAKLDADGNLEWMPAIHMEMPPQAGGVDLTVENDDGAYAVTGHFYPYDHLPGGVILWPQAGKPSSSISFEWDGIVKSLWK
jgi:hypothetical protein